MQIDGHMLFTALLGIVCGILGWLARELWDAVKELRKALAELEVRVTRDYVSYDRLKDALGPVIESLDEIKRTLASKADKS